MTFKHSSIFYIVGALLPVILFISCSTSKHSVVVINSQTVSTTKPDTTAASKTTINSSFQSITIGENQPIHSLDPLFITNVSEMRAVQLVYEGLVRFNSQGKIIPSIAKSWTISNNHRRFQFKLRQNIYFQDSPIFSSGRGRRLRPGDIKKDFERMARDNVPTRAAKLFMNIRGFEPYFQEQHNVFRPSERQIHGISGIKIKNDSTIVFSLVQPDNHFLQKLASPFAVIYPPQAAESNHFEAVGTGPFKLAQKRSDSLFIFARFKNYHGQNQPKLDRVNIVTSGHARTLLQAMKHGLIDIIPGLGPQQMAVVSTMDGSIKSSFSQKYKLLKPTGRTAVFRLQYNPGADLPKGIVTHTLSAIPGKNFFPNLPSNAIRFQWSLSGAGSAALADTLSSSYTDDPFIRRFYSTLSKKLGSRNIVFKMKQTHVVNRTIALQTSRTAAPYQLVQPNSRNVSLGSFTVKIWALAGDYIHHLAFNTYPWWINLRNVTVSPAYNR